MEAVIIGSMKTTRPAWTRLMHGPYRNIRLALKQWSVLSIYGLRRLVYVTLKPEILVKESSVLCQRQHDDSRDSPHITS